MRKRIITYNPSLKTTARNLRKNMTLSEILLWDHLRKRQLKGFQFFRQKPVGQFVVDFFCKELMLAIEVDGDTHDQRIEQDKTRQRQLESMGIHVLRFKDRDVKRNLDGVIFAIEEWIQKYQDKRG